MLRCALGPTTSMGLWAIVERLILHCLWPIEIDAFCCFEIIGPWRPTCGVGCGGGTSKVSENTESLLGVGNTACRVTFPKPITTMAIRNFDKTFKPTARIIADDASWFGSLADIDDIRVLGHSLSDVDLPYLEQIVAHVRPDAPWRVSCRGDPVTLECQFAKFAPGTRRTFWSLPDV